MTLATPPPRASLVCSADAATRRARALGFVARFGPAARLVVVGATDEAAAELLRQAAPAATFGRERTTLGRLAATLAGPGLARAGLTPAGPLVLEALCARVVHALGAELGRFARVADRPGLPRALARTLAELRLAGIGPERLEADPDLARIHRAVDAERARQRLADRAEVLARAAAAARAGEHPQAGLPLVLLDVAVATARDEALVAALAARAEAVLATVPEGDERSLAALGRALGVEPERTRPDRVGSLARLQRHLFAGVLATPEPLDEAEVELLSAPGESRECVELARRILAEASRGVPFDRMAVALRSPTQHRAHLEEALRRAGIPACFAQGTVEPDPAGRALLALLACAAEELSARRFAEYLSLGEVPPAAMNGGPPEPLPSAERWVPPEDELVPARLSREEEEREARRGAGGPEAAGPEAGGPEAGGADPTEAPVTVGTLRAPRRWERLLVDAAVIGGRERWERRLRGLAHTRALELRGLEDPDEPVGIRLRRELQDLAALQRFALPLLERLDTLPARADWGEWLERLSELATLALRHPERALATLAELRPMATVGPIDLAEVRLVLAGRLTDLVERPRGRRAGRLLIAPAEALRGLSFEVVLVPGLAERIFPQKVVEDPVLRDRERRALDDALPTEGDRVERERLALRLAVGAAERRVVLSYPRFDLDQGRPRVPSFYTLEAVRAAAGRLPGFAEVAERAERTTRARIGWPAPARSEEAIDEAEFDLAILEELLRRPADETLGQARYLLGANPHLGRALRFRARRWLRRWTPADGLLDPLPAARRALARHALPARSYSPTALQTFACCPYKFLLYAVHRLAPREEKVAIEEIDPLSRGSLVHEVQFLLLTRLREEGLLPLTPGTLAAARARLEEILDEVAGRFEDELAPAIPRVWSDGIAGVRADLREWLRLTAEGVDDPDGRGWQPWRFELSFGLTEHREQRDPHSTDEPVVLDSGLRLRGSIDLVERRGDGALRATDHKTGKARAKEDTVVGGGEHLQPVLYAAVLEKLFPGTPVDSGRLYYCTSAGGFAERVIPLDDEARDAVTALARTIGGALDEAFLPAAPGEGGCAWCDYQPVCGPYEETRTRRKPEGPLVPLKRLREHR